MTKRWREYVWRDWPDRLVVLLVKVRPEPKWSEICAQDFPNESHMAAITFMSPYWARPRVCKL